MTANAPTSAPLLDAILNLSPFHREHERFYAVSPRETAVVLQRHARALQGSPTGGRRWRRPRRRS